MKSDVKIVLYKDFDFAKVRFYTLKFEGDKQKELDKFFSKYEEKFQSSVYTIKAWLAEIGENRGAQERYFRKEDNVSALPPPTKTIKLLDLNIEESNLNLRLYCIVLSEEVVILVNGGIKESQLTRDSPTCWEQYIFASNIGSQINRQMKNGNCKIIGKQIKRTKAFQLIYKNRQ